MKNILDTAEGIARYAHQGQFRRGPSRKVSHVPYITHPERVFHRLCLAYPSFSAEFFAVAWLHDVLEDTDVTFEDLARQFNPYVTDAVVALTHLGHETYPKYLERVAKNRAARLVKIYDIIDNLSDLPTPRQVVKYSRALEFLSEDLCRECGDVMQPGTALQNTISSTDEGTCSLTGPAEVLQCRKCPACGYSVSK